MDEPEATDEDPEYGSALPDAPEMGDEERYSPRASSRPSFTGDDEDYGGDSDYTPNWAREDEEDWEREGRRHAASFRPDYPRDGDDEESMESALKQKENKKGKKEEKGEEENNEDMLKSLKSSYEHPDTFIEIELNNADSADKVVSYLKTFAGNSEIEINGKMQSIYPNQLQIVEKSDIQVEVVSSYFKGKYYLIEAKFENQFVFFESENNLVEKSTIYLILREK